MVGQLVSVVLFVVLIFLIFLIFLLLWHRYLAIRIVKHHYHFTPVYLVVRVVRVFCRVETDRKNELERSAVIKKEVLES